MNEQNNFPTFEQIADFLTAYSWTFRETTAGEEKKRVIIADYRMESGEGVLLSFRPEGEFVVVSTVDLLRNVPREYAIRMLQLNDTLKLVKMYMVGAPDAEMLEMDLGFELWAESWNKDTFAAFMDMLCFGIETTLAKLKEEGIPHETQFVTYE
jgi:hypothetical protein